MRVSVGTGLRGLAVEGLQIVVARSFAAAMARSAEDGTGMMSVDGYHDKVSAMCSAAVSQAQT